MPGFHKRREYKYEGTVESIYLIDDMTVEEMCIRDRVYGVQANLFTEYIPTPEHAEMMIYPRVLALAKVAWSAPSKKNYENFHVRALKAVEELKKSGYNPFELKNEIARVNFLLQKILL